MSTRLRASRARLGRVLAEGLRRRARPLEDADLRRSAVVVAPHFDDETLGCGGLVLRKRALGADVQVVFMTDGSASHRDWMDPGRLAALREREGRDAAGVLGVPADRVHCLGLPETRLAEHLGEATERVREILDTVRPEQLFVPYRLEPPRDHVATFEAGAGAAARTGRPVTVFEYPIWAWARWPWTAAPPPAAGALRAALRRARGVQRFFAHFRWRVDFPEWRARKREALERHRSQMFRPPDQPGWPVLSEVAGGEFLARFLEPYEVFARLPSPSDDAGPASLAV